MHRPLLATKTTDAEAVSHTIRSACIERLTWSTSEAAQRELRQRVTYAIVAACDTREQVPPLVDDLFTVLEKAEQLG